MLFYLKYFTSNWGPLRIFGSHLVLACFGAILSALLICKFLPFLWNGLPRDRGKKLVKDGSKSAGKPTGAGYVMLLLTLPVLFLILPITDLQADSVKTFKELVANMREIFVTPSLWNSMINRQWGVVACLFAAMLTGYFDDKSEKPWGRFKKGMFDFVIAVATALVLCKGESVEIWIPFWKNSIHMHWFWYTSMSVVLLWITMNATNCSDGVDGLAGTLTLISLFALAIFLYGVVGHETIAEYLLVPHYPEGARWAILTATIGGSVAGYLWHNAEPSKVLMGDAGSRFLGLLVGVAALACGNPFLILVVAPIVLLNGGTGLLKIALLKILANTGVDISNPYTVKTDGTLEKDDKTVSPCMFIRLIHRFRFPFHDHCRHNLNWSNAQVLMRFVLIQAILMPLLFLILVKIR
jgi:phospho-N-acetylmuramoyl-pentapeptide-transferase